MYGKMDVLESQLEREQYAMSQKKQEEVSFKLENEGNRIQFKFKEKTVNGLNKVYIQIPSRKARKIRVVLDMLDKFKGCHKK